jgi:predicted nucleotidyltransferase
LKSLRRSSAPTHRRADSGQGAGRLGAGKFREADAPRGACRYRRIVRATDKFNLSCYYKKMNSQEILAKLRENEPVLRARGVSHAALFGSRARGDDRPDSDIDIMVEFDPTARVTIFNYAGLKDYIAGLFDGPVDVVNRDGLKPYVRPAATTDAIYAF